MAYKVIILYRLYMPSYFLGTFTEYPYSTALKVLQYFQYSTDKIKTDRTQSPQTVIRHCRFSLYLYIFPVTDFYF